MLTGKCDHFKTFFPQKSFWRNELYPFTPKGKEGSRKPESNSKIIKRCETPQGDTEAGPEWVAGIKPKTKAWHPEVYTAQGIPRWPPSAYKSIQCYLRMIHAESLGFMQRHQHFHQKVLMFIFQRKCKAINNTTETKTKCNNKQTGEGMSAIGPDEHQVKTIVN